MMSGFFGLSWITTMGSPRLQPTRAVARKSRRVNAYVMRERRGIYPGCSHKSSNKAAGRIERRGVPPLEIFARLRTQFGGLFQHLGLAVVGELKVDSKIFASKERDGRL